MEALPLIISAIGTGASMMAQRDQAKERRNILNRQLEQNDKATDKSVKLVQEEGKNFDQQSRLAGMQQREDKAYDQAQADIQGAGGTMVDTAAGAGNVSEDFLQSRAARAIDEGNRMTSIAREAARSRAPGMLQFDDSLRFAGLSGDLQNIWGSARNMARANTLEAQGVEPPAYGALGTIASSIAPAMGGFGARTAGGATAAVPSGIDAWDAAYMRAPQVKAGINFGGRR